MNGARVNEVNNNQKVAIIGAGLIGRGWAIVFARAGWRVNLYDLDPGALDNAVEALHEQLKMLAAQGLCTNAQEVLNQITFEADLQAAVLDADYVQECGPELLDAKRALFAELDQLCSLNTILASSTSGFMTSEFAEHLKGRSRVLVAHPVNPPHLEIIEGLSLEIATPNDARAILQLKGREQVAF